MNEYKGYTPGPWQWYGNTEVRRILLVSPPNGIQTVMDFARYGMHAATPRFQKDGLMYRAEEMVDYEVEYRRDITGINHPDARLIAAAPDLLRRRVSWTLMSASGREATWQESTQSGRRA